MHRCNLVQLAALISNLFSIDVTLGLQKIFFVLNISYYLYMIYHKQEKVIPMINPFVQYVAFQNILHNKLFLTFTFL